jgi:transposase
MDALSNSTGRVVSLDIHPDTFTSTILRGTTPRDAILEKTFDKVPNARLEAWAGKHLQAGDTVVMEACGNSFSTQRKLEALGHKALVLESCQMGKLKEAHANNDKMSAVRIAKAYLAGTAKIVWVPDPATQDRRDVFHAQRKAVAQTTRMRNRIGSYLSDNGVRLPKGTSLIQPGPAEQLLRGSKDWSPSQWQVLEGMLRELRHAEGMRKHWRSLIAQEVASDPMLLSLVRLCGIRERVAFALGAIVGDIRRFKSPGSLVKYLGLNPAVDQSGAGTWSGGIGGHGRRDLRALLVQSAQSLLRSSHPLAQWGRKLLARKGEKKVVVAAVARKLAVAVWYLMMGQWTPQEEVDARLRLKLGQIIAAILPEGLNQRGWNRKGLREQMQERLTYVLHRAAKP